MRSRSSWNLEVLVFKERGKPEYPEKNLPEQRRKSTTNLTHIWRRRRDLNPGHIGVRRALSPLRHSSYPCVTFAPRAPPLLLVVGSCCAKFELRANWRNISQQCCVRLHGALHSVWLSVCNGLISLWVLLQGSNQRALESFIAILIHQKS